MVPIEFGRHETRAFLLWAMASTHDEKTLVDAWRLFRKRTRAMLFVVRDPAWGDLRTQATMNFVAVISWHLEGHPTREIVRQLGISRGSVIRYKKMWTTFTPEERTKWLKRIDEARENVRERLDDIAFIQRLKDRESNE